MNFEKLIDLRNTNNYTMQDLSKKLNISKSTYSLWEEGIERFPLERLVKVVDILGVSLDYIMDNSDIKYYEKSKNGIDKKLLANRFKEIRKELKYTQDGFAYMLNLGRTTIINYEKGKTLPLIDQLLYISKNYYISIDYILGKIDNPKYINNNAKSNN